MAKCDVAIQIDRPQERYRPGDRVTGTVHLVASDSMECRRVMLKLEWRTHGRGNRARGGGPEVELAGAIGRMQDGTAVEVPFSFEVPPGPYTYHGHLLNVDWYVTAWADIPAARDPRGEQEIVVVPGDDASALPYEHAYGVTGAPDRTTFTAQQRRAGKGCASGCAVLFAIPFLVAGLVVLGVGLSGLSSGEGRGVSLFAVPFGAIFAVVGALVIFTAVRNRMAERKLGAVELAVEPTTVRPGDTVRCVVRFTPPTAVTVADVRLALVATEVVVSGSGTRRTTHRHQLHREELAGAGQQAVAPGQAFSFEREVAVPPSAAYSFRASDNTLQWMVEATVALAGWPDWKDEAPVVVRP